MNRSQAEDLPIYVQRPGEARTLEIDFGPLLATGDFLTAVDATLTTIIGSVSASVSNVARETGDAPRKASLRITTPAGTARHEYRLDATGTADGGDVVVLPARIRVWS